MIPKLEIVYSWIYNRQFNPRYSFAAIGRLKQKCRKFEKLLSASEARIFKTIQQFSGFDWEEKLIKLYIIEGRPSFSEPLSLRYERSEKVMLMRLVHELCHRIMDKDVEFYELEFYEAAVVLLARYVLAWLFEWRDLRLERYVSKELKRIEWIDLHKHTLEFYLKRYFSDKVTFLKK